MKVVIKLGLSFAISSSLLCGCTASDVNTIVSGGESISTSSVKHTPISASKVKLYYSGADKPRHYQVIGRVSANNDNMMGIPHSHQTISEELKKRAAALGANGVINISSDLERTSGDAISSNRK